MSRHPATLLWVRSIPIAVVLALMTACSSPTHEVGKDAPAPKEPVASPTPAPSKPLAPVAVASAPPADNAPTPPETPVTAVPEPAAHAGDPKTPPPEPAPDPLRVMQDAEARRLDYEQSLARLAAERDAAAELVARREKDLLALKNPYLARPKLAPDEAEEIKGMGGAERVAWAEGRVSDAKAAQEAALKAYDDAKANPPIN